MGWTDVRSQAKRKIAAAMDVAPGPFQGHPNYFQIEIVKEN